MPRRGALRGARPLRWSVDLSPAEFAYVEATRGAYGGSRAQFVVALARNLERRLANRGPTIEQARAVLQAEFDVLEEEDAAAGRDRYGRGGRRPRTHLLGLDDVTEIHRRVRLHPDSASLLVELLAEQDEGEEDGHDGDI